MKCEILTDSPFCKYAELRASQGRHRKAVYATRVVLSLRQLESLASAIKVELGRNELVEKRADLRRPYLLGN
jgi:hypothetical protein